MIIEHSIMHHVGFTASQIGVSSFTTQFGRIMNVVYMTVIISHTVI